jgi:hypothetical protein
MILVGMGNDKSIKQVPAAGNEIRVRHLDAGTASTSSSVLLKRNAAIHHQPAAVVAIQIEVHANFAASPQWQKPGSLRPRLHSYHA